MLPGSLALLGDANFGMLVPIPTYHRVLGPMSPLGRGSPTKQSSREVLPSGLQKPWSAVRAKQLAPPPFLWDGRGCLAAGWMLDADKISPNSSLLLTAMRPSQGISPLYPGHLSQAVTVKNTHTGGLL